MSRGPGRIERAIRELFDTHPDLAFVTDELAEHCYRDARPITQKHRVAVLRAARNVLKGDPDWCMSSSESQGGTMTFYNQANARSWALASIIGAWHTIYRSPKRTARHERIKFGSGWSYCTVIEDRPAAIKFLDDRPSILARYSEFAQRHTAYRNADAESQAAMDAEQEAGRAAWIAAAKAIMTGQDKRLEAAAPPVSQHLSQELAYKAHALMVENDPDAIRAGLAEIADALRADGNAA